MPLPVAVPIAMAAASVASQMASNNAQNRAINNAMSTLEEAEGYADLMKKQGTGYLDQMQGATQALYGTPEQAAAALNQARSNVNNLDPYQAGQFSYDKSIDDFYDKALGLRMNAANDAINQSQAVGGNLFSSDTANKLVAQAQVLGSDAYNQAMNAYNQDKSLEQNIWQGNEAAKQAAASSAANLAQLQYGMANDTASNLSNSNNAYYQGLLNLNDDYWQNKADYAAQMAQLKAQKKKGGLLSTLSGGLL